MILTPACSLALTTRSASRQSKQPLQPPRCASTGTASSASGTWRRSPSAGRARWSADCPTGRRSSRSRGYSPTSACSAPRERLAAARRRSTRGFRRAPFDGREGVEKSCPAPDSDWSPPATAGWSRPAPPGRRGVVRLSAAPSSSRPAAAPGCSGNRGRSASRRAESADTRIRGCSDPARACWSAAPTAEGSATAAGWDHHCPAETHPRGSPSTRTSRRT